MEEIENRIRKLEDKTDRLEKIIDVLCPHKEFRIEKPMNIKTGKFDRELRYCKLCEKYLGFTKKSPEDISK